MITLAFFMLIKKKIDPAQYRVYLEKS